MSEHQDFSYEAWHTKGLNQCGGLAWTFICHPSESMASKNVILPDGSSQLFGQRIVCAACGEIPMAGTLKEAIELRHIKRLAP